MDSNISFSTSSSTEIVIRAATRDDCSSIMSLKKELAEHQNMGNLPMLSPEDLERDGFDENPPYFYCLVAEVNSTKLIVGYALYYINYPIWEGKGILLEDLCVSKDCRGKGIGKLLLQELAKIAINGNYSRITLECLDQNPSTEFYKKLHGVDFTESGGWHVFRCTKSDLIQLASSL